MAVVTEGDLRVVTPPGEGRVRKGVAAEDLLRGQLLVQDNTGYSVAPTNTIVAHGICLKDAVAGQENVDVGVQGEMDGYVGLTEGAPLYPSGTTAGAIDDSAPTYYAAATTPAVAVPAPANIRAISDTRISFSFV